jgi:hypothetical protein
MRDDSDLQKLMQEVIEQAKVMPLVCSGCGRDALHKMCPAWGTPVYCNPSHPLWGKATDVELQDLKEANGCKVVK